MNYGQVSAKFGYYRIHDRSNTPPTCLVMADKDDLDAAEPKCAFARCLHPPACLGTTNDEFKHHYYNEKGDLSQLGFNQTAHNTDQLELCDSEKGYLNNGLCNVSNAMNREQNYSETRCRLCATCMEGYKRASMSSTKCVKCPDSATNKIFLAVGVFVMIFGCITLIYLTIESEGGSDATSDAIKKIILNFLQIASLAGGLPLQWPSIVNDLFETMGTVASAGSNLLIPDCELSSMRTSDAFYLKQFGFTFMVPCIVIMCYVGWTLVFFVCGRRWKITRTRLKDYMILTVVLMLFLCYPMVVRLSLSTLQCPTVGDRMYLMADLEEPCFVGRHSEYILFLTIPQLILYVFGLPIAAGTIILRTKAHRRWTSFSFRMRYGLLFMGYRRERYWWELVIVVRKVTIVMIGTFGTLMGRVDLQAYVALLVIFFSIVIHLVGKPFNTEKEDTNLLYKLEFLGLSVCWGTFWGGLIFYLGPNTVPEEVRVGMSCLIWIANIGYLIYAIKCYIAEFYRDEVKKRKVRRNTMSQKQFKANLKRMVQAEMELKQWKVKEKPKKVKKKRGSMFGKKKKNKKPDSPTKIMPVVPPEKVETDQLDDFVMDGVEQKMVPTMVVAAKVVGPTKPEREFRSYNLDTGEWGEVKKEEEPTVIATVAEPAPVVVRTAKVVQDGDTATVVVTTHTKHAIKKQLSQKLTQMMGSSSEESSEEEEDEHVSDISHL